MKTPALNNRLAPAARPSRLPSPAIYLARLRSALSQTKAIFVAPANKLTVREKSDESSAAE